MTTDEITNVAWASLIKLSEHPWVAALFIGIASEFFPIVGMLAAALVFPQGIHSDHAYAYLALAMSLNFAIFFTATLYIFRFFIRRRYRTISK